MPRQNVLKQQSKGFAWTAMPSATRSMYFSVNSLFNGASALLGSVLCSALIGVLEAYPPHALRCIFFVGLAGALAAAVMAARIPCREA